MPPGDHLSYHGSHAQGNMSSQLHEWSAQFSGRQGTMPDPRPKRPRSISDSSALVEQYESRVSKYGIHQHHRPGFEQTMMRHRSPQTVQANSETRVAPSIRHVYKDRRHSPWNEERGSESVAPVGTRSNSSSTFNPTIDGEHNGNEDTEGFSQFLQGLWTQQGKAADHKDPCLFDAHVPSLSTQSSTDESATPTAKRPKAPCPIESPGFICPFRARNPVRFNIRAHRSCALTPYESVATLKAHIKRCHNQRSCPRCHNGFADDEALQSHLQSEDTERCRKRSPSRIPRDPEDGISFEVDRLLVERKRKSKLATWNSIYRELFPSDASLPEPDFHAPVELDEVEAFITASMPGLNDRLQQHLGSSTNAEGGLADNFMIIFREFMAEQFRSCRIHYTQPSLSSPSQGDSTGETPSRPAPRDTLDARRHASLPTPNLHLLDIGHITPYGHFQQIHQPLRHGASSEVLPLPPPPSPHEHVFSLFGPASPLLELELEGIDFAPSCMHEAALFGSSSPARLAPPPDPQI